MLSVVAIGRNESLNIPRLAESIQALADTCDFPVESIYIDSASTDNSVALARERFDKVRVLESSEHLCASAGRFAGTLEARYPWILYLDADMEICSEFFPVVSQIEDLEPYFVGLIGLYIHRLDNGASTIQSFTRLVNRGVGATQFGGAVILNRDAVIRAGNWDPSIYGKEEMELYVRLGDGEQVVKFVTLPMIYHYSEYYSRVELVLRLLYPSAGLGKVFWGYGQSLRALAIKGNIFSLMRLDYEPYLFWLGMILVTITGLLVSWKWAAALGACAVAGFSLWLRPGSLVRYLTLPLSMVPGWFKYFPWFRPEIEKWAGRHSA
ncbi:MAG: glycosyltransferase [Gammaproteobacteria bacterium]|nr:glycosyltransferase [Gammaproteobacteria bacterium]